MEKIIKLQSDNQFTEQAVPGAFTTCNLLDFTIPGNATYDLSKSFIAINAELILTDPATGAPAGKDTQATPDTALYNTTVSLDTQGGSRFVSQCASLVRNCQLESQNRGMVESIRRVDTLRQCLYNLENDKQMQQERLENLGPQQGKRGVGNLTTDMIQAVVRNVDNQNNAQLGLKSKGIDRDFRIPISDLFGVGNAMWNGEVYGPTRMHLEMNINKLALQNCGGIEDVTNGPNGTETYGEMLQQAAVAGGTDLTVMQTKLRYKDYSLNFPFYVGQAISVTTTDSVRGGAQAVQHVIIDSIDYSNNNSQATPGGDESMTITTRTPFYSTPGAQANTNIDVLIKAYLPNFATSLIRINKADIVLAEQVGVQGPSEIDYRTYVSEIQVGTGNNYFHQYSVEAEAQNLIIASCDTNEIAPNRPWFDYRISIDNIDQTGNRSVEWAGNLHQDRIMRFFNNRGQNVDNLSLSMIDTALVQGIVNPTRPNQVDYFPLLETLPLTPAPKDVQIQMTGGVFGGAAAVQDIILYKEIVKTI
tara:strand:- start:5768 stop:7363 length:1596 start_codon:yes stop_codon:yes gene_type:complete